MIDLSEFKSNSLLSYGVEIRGSRIIMNHSTRPITVYRGHHIESTHDIHVAIVSAKGRLLGYYGDANRLTFARSSMKPFQALPIVESGATETYKLTDRELSLFCASHSGEPFHRETVADVLEKIDLTEKHLQCGTHIPRDKESYHALIKSGGELTPIYSNCSGKHVGMLAGSMKQEYDINTYRELEHPYQQQIVDVIADISDYQREMISTSVDGCGVPVHQLPLYHLALAFGRLAKPEDWTQGGALRKKSLMTVRDAMATYPEMVAGTKRFDTDLMKAYQGRIVAKGGAEGVHCFGDKETGIGVAIKVEDGNARATNIASMHILKSLEIGSLSVWNQLSDYSEAPVLNARDEKIGVIQPNFELTMIYDI